MLGKLDKEIPSSRWREVIGALTVTHMTEPPLPPGDDAYGVPPGSTPPPPGYANSDEKTWALVAHFGGAAAMLISSGTLGWVPPLIAMLTKGKESLTVRAHAVAALNHQLLWSIVGVAGWILLCAAIGALGILGALVMGVVFGIIAGLKANEGILYKYPLSVNMIK